MARPKKRAEGSAASATNGVSARVTWQTMALETLHDAAYNPRTISGDALRGLGAIIDRFGVERWQNLSGGKAKRATGRKATRA
jgi:hypothetical protein